MIRSRNRSAFSTGRHGVVAVLGLVLGLSAGVVQNAFAQGAVDRNHVPSLERTDSFERRSDNIDGNNIRATITNWAQTAQSGNPGDFFYEWPKNTNRIYISLTQLWVGTKIQGAAADGNDLYILDVSDFRSNPVDENISWTFEPIKGYVNPGGEGIAQSDEPTSWPTSWPDKVDDASDPGWAGSWNGLFGKDIFNADQEFFFKIGDDQYNRYPTYFPDSTDLTRKGMGLIAEVRLLAWSQILIDDVVFLIHGVTNDGTEDLTQVGMSMWLADLVGGDASDDIPFFDLLEDVAFMTDADGVGTEPFGSDPVGEAAFAFLETPGNATDRIDNDADGSTAENCDPLIGECNSPVVPVEFLVGEDPTNGIDDNGNGLIDENETHTPFSGGQAVNIGVGYADRIDNDSDGEAGSPVVTAEMIAAAAGDAFQRWPANPQNDSFQNGQVHLIGVDETDLGLGFADGIDNDNSAVTPSAAYPYLYETDSPVVTQAMIDQAASDPFRRYRVSPSIILYDVGPEDLGKAYADGIDNDDDGAIDEGIDEGIDEMIDESREDGIDNDGDWNPLQNDTGLDGIGFTGDAGDSDGLPTTGAGTNLPGERNIDKTDISESDQIGITNVQITPAFSINFGSQSDRFLFLTYMIPGLFDADIPEPGENDLVVSSGLFPLKAGQTERISLSIQIGLTREEVLGSRDNALQAYLEDYQFAQAPITPELSAVPGDGRVTLYWNSEAEDSFDEFLSGLGRDPNDFEGYRVYRSTDPAFLDPKIITDGRGNLLFRKPMAEFDLIDEHAEFHPVDVNGVKFYMGNNRRDPGEDSNGLAHVYVDSTAQNGITYFYAVTAFDYGSAMDNIPPTETPIRIQRLADGTIRTGNNVVQVVPTPPVAGYVDASLSSNAGLIERVQGSTSSTIRYRVMDPTVIKDNHTYRITFEDTLIVGTAVIPDTLTTKSFSVTDVTEDEVVISRSQDFRQGTSFPVFDDFGQPLGFQLIFTSEPFVSVDRTKTCWNRVDGVCTGASTNMPTTLDPYVAAGFVKGLRNPTDYRVKVVGAGQGQSTELQVRRTVTLPSRPTNVEVYRVTPEGQEIPVDYAFWDITGDDFVSATATTAATWSADPARGESDLLILYETKVGDDGGDKIVTWRIGLNFTVADATLPVAGDVADIVLRKPFLSTDAFEFTTSLPSVSKSNPDSLLAQVRVVPNPYVVTNEFEALNPFSTGRGPRVIKFMNLPPEAIVRIFTVGGKQVRELRLNEGSNDGLSPDALLNGSLSWNLESEDGLTVSYGVYLYHVEAPGLGEKSGTFAIIK